MSCTIINGREIDCRDSAGGIEEVYITEWSNIASITETSGVVTSISMNSGKKFFTFQLEKENGMFDETEQNSVENGSLFYEGVLSFTTKKMTAAARNAFNILAKNRLMIIFKDRNGAYWLLGRYGAADKVGENKASTGKAFGDLNGYTLTFTTKEKEPAFSFTGTVPLT
jgi:hypothetical protein